MLEEAEKLTDQLIKLRRTFHEYPETGFTETETTGRIESTLKNLGIETERIGTKTGVMGTIQGNGSGPVVALRADMDALPIQELNDIPYRSKRDGVMHACGHDVHMTCLLGAAKLLQDKKDQFKGTVKLLFQPAEEIDTGAKYCIEEGVLQGVDAIFGLHNTPDLPVGTIGIQTGPSMAATDRFVIHLTGVGGHGAQPQVTKDPVVTAAAVIQGLQTIVARNINPADTAVVSCCSIHGGDMYNVIPATVTLTGTVRTFSTELQDYIARRMKDLTELIAQGYGVQSELEYIKELPPLVNPADMAELCRQAARIIVGPDRIKAPAPYMISEDFAIYQQQIPGAFVFLGVGNPAAACDKPLHSPDYMIDERALPYGAAMLAQTALEFLGKK